MLLSARTLKRVSLKSMPPMRGRLAATTDTAGPKSTDSPGADVSPALALAREQISASPSQFVAMRQQANGE